MISLLNNRLLWTVSIGHFVIDLYANILPIMFPFLMATLNLSYAGVGFIVTMYALTSSLSQPLFGYIADKFGGRFLAPGGIVWMAVFMGLVGFAPDYLTLLALVFLAGLGSAAFHPQGAMNASAVGGERKGTSVSFFMLGGNMGYSLGPVIGAMLVTGLGLRGIAMLALPSMLVAVWLFGAMVAVDQHKRRVVAEAAGKKPAMKVALVGLISLIVIIMLRSWTMSGLTAFIPLLYRDSGYSIDQASQTLFLMLLAVAVGGLMGGFLSDMIGRRRVTFLSLLLLAPTVYLFVMTLPPWSMLVAVPLGLCLGSTYAITIVMAQEMLPSNVGVASGLVLGLAFVTGGIGVSITGFMADNLGLSQGLNVLAFMPLVAAALCVNLRPAPKAAGVAVNG